MLGESLPKIDDKNKDFDELRLHEQIVKYGKIYFIRGEYTKAVNECCKAYIKYIGKVSGIDEEDGTSLMRNALSEESGIIKINNLKTLSEISEQRGIMFLSEGIVAAARNPTGHEPEGDWKLEEWEAKTFLLLLSYLWEKVDYGIKTFGLAEDKRIITYINSITTENRERYIANWKKFSADFKLKVFSAAIDRSFLNSIDELFIFVETVLSDYPVEKYKDFVEVFLAKFVKYERTNYDSFRKYRYMIRKFLNMDIFKEVITKNGYLTNFIKIFEGSGSFDEAASNANTIDILYDILTPEQKNKLFKACISNSQISGSYGAQNYVRKWIKAEDAFVNSSDCTLKDEEKTELYRYIKP